MEPCDSMKTWNYWYINLIDTKKKSNFNHSSTVEVVFISSFCLSHNLTLLPLLSLFPPPPSLSIRQCSKAGCKVERVHSSLREIFNFLIWIRIRCKGVEGVSPRGVRTQKPGRSWSCRCNLVDPWLLVSLSGGITVVSRSLHHTLLTTVLLMTTVSWLLMTHDYCVMTTHDSWLLSLSGGISAVTLSLHQGLMTKTKLGVQCPASSVKVVKTSVDHTVCDRCDMVFLVKINK